MKRGGPLRRYTALKAKTEIARTGWTTPQRTPINKVSAKRKIENRIRTKVLRQLREAVHVCQAQCVKECTGETTDGHEVLSRARGGSITDVANIKLACRPCHEFITTNPDKAAELGLAVSGDRTVGKYMIGYGE